MLRPKSSGAGGSSGNLYAMGALAGGATAGANGNGNGGGGAGGGDGSGLRKQSSFFGTSPRPGGALASTDIVGP